MLKKKNEEKKRKKQVVYFYLALKKLASRGCAGVYYRQNLLLIISRLGVCKSHISQKISDTLQKLQLKSS